MATTASFPTYDAYNNMMAPLTASMEGLSTSDYLTSAMNASTSATSSKTVYPRSSTKSNNELQKASRADEPHTLYARAQALLNLRRDPGCIFKGLSLIRTAADQGHTDSQVWLGVIYDKGLYGIQADPNVATDWYKKAEKQGSIEASFNLLHLRAEHGDSEKQYSLAQMFEEGRFVSEDLIDTRKEEQYVAKDPIEALEWYTEAAYHGHPQAQFRAAFMLEHGTAFGQCIREAAMWYCEAGRQGHKEGISRLQWLCHFHHPSDIRESERVCALKWMKEAADAGDATAAYQAAVQHHRKDGTSADSLYLRAARLGHPVAKLITDYRNQPAKSFRNACHLTHISATRAPLKLDSKCFVNLMVEPFNRGTLHCCPGVAKPRYDYRNKTSYAFNSFIRRQPNDWYIYFYKKNESYNDFIHVMLVHRSMLDSDACRKHGGDDHRLLFANRSIFTGKYKNDPIGFLANGCDIGLGGTFDQHLHVILVYPKEQIGTLIKGRKVKNLPVLTKKKTERL